MLQSTWHSFLPFELEYLEQFVVALLPMSLTVAIHGQGMNLAARYFRRHGTPAGGARRGSATLTVVMVVGIMLATHFSEVAAWAAYFLATGMLTNVQDAMTFSINSYTTLGASNIQLTGRWRGFDGFEAISAMLMFGWSTAVLAAIVQKTHSIDS